MPLDYAPSHIRNKPRLPKNVCYEFKEDAFRGTRSRVDNLQRWQFVLCMNGQRGHGQCNKTGWVDTGLYDNQLGKFLGIGGNAVFLKRPTSKVAADGGSPGRVTFGDTIGLQ